MIMPKRLSRKILFGGVFLASVTAGLGLGIQQFYAAESLGLLSAYKKISDTEGTFSATIDDSDQFGSGVDDIGDLNNDGVTDLVVGAWKDDDGGTNFGAVYILFMNSDGTVGSYQKISMSAGGFTGAIDSADDFGFVVSGIGDLNGDGNEDITVSERANDNGGTDRGAFYVLFLNSNGTVSAEQRVSDTAGGFTGTLDNFDIFGECAVAIPDVNGDDVADLAVCAKQDDDGGTDRGALWVLYMNTDGTVSSYHKIASGTGGFSSSALDNSDKFGAAMTTISDLNGDGVREWVVGSVLDDDGATDAGAVYVLFMNSDGTVASQAKISATTTNFTGQLESADRFGNMVADAGDLDGDGLSEILVGAWTDDDGATDAGSAYLIYLNSAGGVKKFQKYSGASNVFTGSLAASDNFAVVGATVGDFNGDNLVEFALGAIGDDDGGTDRGAVWLLYPAMVTGSSADSSVYPGNPTLTINDGDECTATPEVTLNLGATNSEKVIISNDEFFVDSSTYSFTGTSADQAWTLPDEDGEHTVYVVYRSSSQDLSMIVSDTITLDQEDACGTAVPEEEADEEVTEDIEEDTNEDESSDEPTLALSPFTGELEEVEAIEPGEYVRGESYSTVYYVDENLKRRPFYDVQTFFTWQDSFDNVRVVTDASLPQLTIGAPMLPKPGAVFVKIESIPTVYVVTEEAGLRAIANESVATDLAGTDWNEHVIDVPVYLFDDFSFGAEINDADDVVIDTDQLKTRDELNGGSEVEPQFTDVFMSLWQKITTKF